MCRYVWLNALNVTHIPNLISLPPLFRHWRDMLFMFKQFFYSDWTALPSSVLSIQKLGDCVKSIHLSKTRLVYETTEPVLATFQTYRYVIQPENLEHWKTRFPDPKRKVQCKQKQKQSRPFVPCFVQWIKNSDQVTPNLWITSFWMAGRRVKYFVCSTRNLIAYFFEFLNYFD